MVYSDPWSIYLAGERMKAAKAVRAKIIGATARLRLGRRTTAGWRRVPGRAGVMPLAAAIVAALLASAPAEAQSAQRVLGVSIQSSPGSDGFYTDGETITVRVRFSGPGRPRLFSGQSASIDIDIGGVTQKATISGDRHQTEWDLTYRVRPGDRDLDGISIPANGLSGQFSCGTGCTPNMAHSAVAASSTHTVLATPSVPGGFSVDGGAGEATLRWNRDTGAHSSRAYEYQQDGGGWTSAGGANASSHTVTLAAGTYRFELRARNRTGAGAATNARRVTVTDAPSGPTGPTSPDAAVTVVVDPTSLTVVEGRSRAYQVRLSAAPSADVTVTISSSAAVVTAAPAELTFTASDWSMPQTVTVTAAQDDDTDDGAATLSHTLSGSGVDRTGPTLRVTVTDDDAAGVDLPDELTFGDDADQEVAAQRYAVGMEVNVTLPAATGGTPPLRYRLTPDLPEGLSFNAATRVVSGTPAAAAEETEYTLTVTDAQDYQDELRFSITVQAAGAAAGEEAGPAQVRSAALANVLASYGGAVAADAVELVGDRFIAIGPRLQLPEGATDADAVLAGSAFAAPAPGGWALWGRGALSGFSTATEDGSVLSGYLGADWRSQPDILVGGAVAYGTAGDVNYRGAAGAAAGSKGKATVTTVIALPYAHWSPSRGLGVWALAGLGGGAAAVTPAGSAAAIETGVFLALGGAGVRYDVVGWPGGSAAVKVDGFLASLSTAEQPGLASANATPGRLRLLFETRTRWEFREQSWLQPVVEVGGRFDGAIGAEFGGGVSYRHTGIGLGADVRGRYVLAERQEWGASAALSYTLGESGWSFALNVDATPEEHTGSPAYALALHGSLRM